MRFCLSRPLHALTCHWLSKAEACQGMPRFNPISKYSGIRPRSLHMSIIRWPCGCKYQSKTLIDNLLTSWVSFAKHSPLNVYSASTKAYKQLLIAVALTKSTKHFQLVCFALLCNKINITVSFLQSSILTKFVCLFTSSLAFHIVVVP